MKKEEARAHMKGLRTALTDEEIERRSALICSALFSKEEYKSAKTVMVYLSAFGEADTEPIIADLRKRGARVAVPVSDKHSSIITPVFLEGELLEGAYGIKEPAQKREVPVDEIDLVIVPGVAFDKEANRCGFGKGYYDRLLKRTNAYRIGICYDFQIVDELETDEYDVPMNEVICDKFVILNS